MNGSFEVESMIPDVDFKKTCESIKKIGGKEVFLNTQYTFISVQNKHGEKIRIIEKGDDVVAKNGNAEKQFDTLEQAIDNYSGLGYHEISRDIKDKTFYTLNISYYNDYPISLIVDKEIDKGADKDGALGTKLSIKIAAVSDAPEVVEMCREVIDHVSNLLGYTQSNLKPWTAEELFKYNREKKRFYSF